MAMDTPEKSATAMRQDLAKTVRDSYRGRYDDLVQAWRASDTKAQGTAAIGGVFIAALFAFVRDAATRNAEPAMAVVLIAAAVLTSLSVGASLLALRMRRVPAPPLGKATEDLVTDILACPDDELAARLSSFYRDDASLWRQVDDEVYAVSGCKTRWVWASQLLLFAAIIVMSSIAVCILISSTLGVS
jgi:hypothetical protein